MCHVAAQYGQTGVLYHLALKWGVDLDAPDSDGRTALHWAAYKGFADTIRLLLVMGCRPTQPDKEGCTPLHWAAIRGNAEACTVLLQVRQGKAGRGRVGCGRVVDLWCDTCSCASSWAKLAGACQERSLQQQQRASSVRDLKLAVLERCWANGNNRCYTNSYPALKLPPQLLCAGRRCRGAAAGGLHGRHSLSAGY